MIGQTGTERYDWSYLDRGRDMIGQTVRGTDLIGQTARER